MSTRIKGVAALFKLAATDYAGDCTEVRLTSEDASASVTTFADAAAGGSRQWFFEGTAVQSTDATSLWSYLWDNAGAVDVDFVYAPHGNAVASATQPHFTGTCTIPAKPDVGGEAGTDVTHTFDFRINVDTTPTMVEA